MRPARKIYQAEAHGVLDALIRTLKSRGYDVIGPTVRDRSIILANIASINDMPRGMSDIQEKGTYRLTQKDGDKSFFGYNLGPASWKSFLFPERRRLWRLQRSSNPESDRHQVKPFAFLGVRACELAAITIQDRVFIRDHGDPEYKQRRESTFIIGVHCSTAAATCFCPSMGTGPEFSDPNWDMLLTEDDDQIMVEAATSKGHDILSALSVPDAPQHAQDIINAQLEATRHSITRQMDQKNIKEHIYEGISSHNWEDVGTRCLACANCTLVCPTCFCSTVEDVSDVENVTAERWQKWDSCFHIDFTYVHGGSRRVTTASRYRQWLTHKLATWHDQFGTSGCVGCGRCISWCPVGIDLTEEVAAIRKEGPTGGRER